MCGVKRQRANEDTHVVVMDSEERAEVCKVCTFINHTSMMDCEMCGASLKSEQHVNRIMPGEIRLSFRRSGHSSFLSQLKTAINVKQWEMNERETSNTLTPLRGVGISKLSFFIKIDILKSLYIRCYSGSYREINNRSK